MYCPQTTAPTVLATRADQEDTMTDSPPFLTIAEAATLIQSRTLAPSTLVQTLLDRIEACNPQIDAFVTLLGEKALDCAKQADQEIESGIYRGPLHGIPFGLKDIYYTAGVPTTGHSRTAKDHVPETDATVTQRLLGAGGVLMGKLSTHEFAHGGPSFDLPWPPARNPWNRDHFTGGSSSGSGAAIAAGFLLGAMGSDTGGSIRNPAALCGIVGLKPTYGLVSRRGVIPNSFTFDHCGPMAWTVEDCAIMLGAIAGHDPDDPSSANATVPDYRDALTGDIRGLRVGIVRHFWEEDLPANAEVCSAMEAALDVLTGLGAACEDVRLLPMQDYYDVKVVIAESELFSVHRQDLCDRPGEFGMDFLARSLPACLFSGADYVAAQRLRRLQLEAMAPLYASYDVLVTAGPYGPAPRLDAHSSIGFWRKPSIATPFDVTAGPALSQCNGFSESGLPLAMQIIGRPFDEATVLRVADAYEKATPWRRRRPHLEPGLAPLRPPPEPPPTPPVTLDMATQDLVTAMAQRAGLDLDDTQLVFLFEAAPDAFAMADRLRRPLSWSTEPASTFTFPAEP
jgi:aspartyl-tRNA(Asn)/glutamyl-tRNA(Gln) amidotransferase subunit A